MMCSTPTSDGYWLTLKEVAADVLSVAPSAMWLRPRPRLEIQSNNLFDAGTGEQRIVIKEFLKPDEFIEAPNREFKALELLSHLDIAPQPRAIFPQKRNRRPLVVYDYMDGQMWDRRTPGAEDLARLSDIWIQMNSIQDDNLWLSRHEERPILRIWQDIEQLFDGYFSWAKSEIHPAASLLELCRTICVKGHGLALQLSRVDFLRCFCRADPRFANVISRPGSTLGIVDWEDSGLRDPAKDLADVLTHPNQEDLLSWYDWKAFLDPYLASRNRDDPTIEKRFQLYLGLFPVWWLGILLNEGVRRFEKGVFDGWSIHGIEPNQKLGRYLGRALAWPNYDYDPMGGDFAGTVFFPGEA